MSEISNVSYINVSGRNRSRRKTPIITVIFIITIAFILIRKATTQNSSGQEILHAQVETGLFTPSPLPTVKTSKKTPLLPQIEKIISEKSGTFSVYVVDLSTGQEYALNSEMIVDAASVNKIPVLASLYYFADKGEIDLEKIIVPQPKDIQDYGTGSIRYDKPGSPYSIKTLARLMMEKSDNTAAYLLASHIVGLDKIEERTKEWGLTQTDMYKNTTSNKDVALLLTKMYKGEITSKALTAEMLDFMDKSDFDDRIHKGLPEGITVYHKTGDAVGKIHDTGIVDLPDNPYYIGILTTDMTSVEGTKDVIGEISKVVFDYMRES